MPGTAGLGRARQGGDWHGVAIFFGAVMDIEKIRYFPLDYDSLNKGDVITTEQIEQFGQCSRDDDKRFRLAAMKLKKKVESACRDRGKRFTLAIIKGAIRILTDEEAAEYNPRQFKQGFRRQIRSLRRLSEVNTSTLADQQKQDHERNLLVFGKMVQAARSARSQVNTIAYQRTTPGIPGVQSSN